MIVCNHYIQTRLINRYIPLIQLFNLIEIIVNAQDLISHLCEASSSDQPNIAGTNYSYFHIFCSSLR